jgi:hypothetical protein
MPLEEHSRVRLKYFTSVVCTGLGPKVAPVTIRCFFLAIFAGYTERANVFLAEKHTFSYEFVILKAKLR